MRIKVHFIQWIYGLGLLYLTILCIWQWLQYPDQINEFFGQNASLLQSTYYLAAVFIFSLFCYLAFRLLASAQPRKADSFWLLVLFLAISSLYVGSFFEVLAPNGDNAEYIINAKSIIELGGVYRLETPTQTPNSLASLGLPFLLAPIYAIWGLNFFPMKMLILLLGIATGPILFAFFRRDFDFYQSALLALVAFTSPFLVTNSTTIMTEGPYLFWSLCTILVVQKYAEKPAFSWRLYLGMFFLLAWTYLTRAIGISLLVATILYLSSRVSWLRLLSRSTRRDQDRKEVAKLLWVFLPLFFGFVFWQIWQQNLGVSQISVFLRLDLMAQMSDNFIAFKNVVAQLLFSPGSFRWYKQSSDFILSPFNFFWLMLLLIIVIGILVDLKSRKLVAFYSIALIIVLMLASTTPQERVFMRYLSVLIPFLLYHFYSAIRWAISRLDHFKFKWLAALLPVVPIVILGHIMVTHLTCNRYNVLTKGAVFNSWYKSFLTAAEWCGQNLPSDAYIMSVKPRIVYLYSGLPGFVVRDERDIYNAAYEKAKLEEIKSRGITHIIVDAISRATMDNIHPIIQNNPDKFEKLPVPGLEDKCTVVKVRPY